MTCGRCGASSTDSVCDDCLDEQASLRAWMRGNDDDEEN